jgi:hypothetical protein
MFCQNRQLNVAAKKTNSLSLEGQAASIKAKDSLKKKLISQQ